MDQSMRDNGIRKENLETAWEYKSGLMDPSMRVIGRTTWQMEEVDYVTPT